MADLELRELLSHDLADDLAPQPTGSQDVGLVQTPNLSGGILRHGQAPAETGDALNLMTVVGLGIAGVAGAVVLDAVAKVDAAGELTDDDEIGAAADRGLERGALD